MARPTLSRAQILGFRLRQHGLARTGSDLEAITHVLDLGVQDTPYGTAADALTARGVALEEGTGAGELVRVWSRRGAPHFHRPGDLKRLAAALWPLDEDDAAQRIGRQHIGHHAERGLAAFAETATAMRKVVTKRMSKGEVSRAVSDAVSDDLNYDCRGCKARHITGGLFQLAGLAAGMRVVVEGRTTYLEPLPAKIGPGVPRRAQGAGDEIDRYLTLMGAASRSAMASTVLSAPASSVAPHLPEVVEVDTPAGRAVTTPSALSTMESFDPREMPAMVRLLPASDPWLAVRDRDRELIVPDKSHRQAVWRVLGNPGVVLVDAEVAGTWRAKAGKKNVLAVTVEPFAKLSKATAAAIEDEAQRLATGRGASSAQVSLPSN